jgi:citrate lyase alpha subunit
MEMNSTTIPIPVKTYGIIDVKTEQVISNRIIDKEYEDIIKTPYGIAVNPNRRHLYDRCPKLCIHGICILL